MICADKKHNQNDGLDKLEERYLNDEIEFLTYKKWFGKLSTGKAFLNSRIDQLASTNQDKQDMPDEFSEQITDLKLVYEIASLRMKRKLLNVVFEAGLIFNGRCFRTAYLHPALSLNYLKIK